MQLSVRTIEKHWPLTGVRIRSSTLGKGGRVTAHIAANEGEYIFKIADRKRPEAIVKKDLAVLRFLEGRGYEAAPKLLPMKEGAPYRRVNGRIVYAMEYIEGVVPKSTQRNWRELGKALASLHRIAAPPNLSSAFTVASQRAKLLRQARKARMEAAYGELVKALPHFDDVPRSVIHTDAGLHNAIKRPDGSLVLVDWDDAGGGPAVLDIGYVLTNLLTSKLRFQGAKAVAFLEGYGAVRAITKREKLRAVDAGLLFGLSYSINDQEGIDSGYWKWTRYIASHRSMFEELLTSPDV